MSIRLVFFKSRGLARTVGFIMFTHPARPRTNEGVRMKLNLEKRNEKRLETIAIRVPPATKKKWYAIIKAHPGYKGGELFNLAIESLIKEYGTEE